MRWMIVLLATTSVVWAHAGVKNPAVMARMDGMKAMGDAAKVLGEITKGARPYDAAVVADALERLEAEAKAVPDLFAKVENDPASEALPNIWTDQAAFNELAAALETLAGNAQVDGPASLAPLMKQIGATCSDCHKVYRK